MKTPPDKIYLQFWGDTAPEPGSEVVEEAVSWCADKIFEYDITYVRAELIHPESKVIWGIRQTCGACPSQWEGVLEDGRFVYIRFRDADLTCGVGFTLASAIANAEAFDTEGGDLAGGEITLEEVAEALPHLKFGKVLPA